MGMTLWIHTLEDREFSKDSDDHSLMHEHADAIDALCEAAGVRKLSDYFDFTDLEYSYAVDGEDDDEEDEGDGAILDPETGYAYGIDDMQWFAADEGIATLRLVRERVDAGALQELDEDNKAVLLEELDDCLKVLDGTAARQGRFHLAVIE
jgi:hypothetical protein